MERAKRSAPLAASAAVTRFTVQIVFLVVATASVILRLYCRRLKRLRLAWSDWLVILALVFLYGYFASGMIEIFAGYSGHHIQELNAHQLEIFAKAIFAGELLYPWPVTLARLSINLFFIEIFNRLDIYCRLAYANIGLNVCWLLYCLIEQLARCHPVARNWRSDITYGSCASWIVVEVVKPIWGIVCDLTTWTLPIPYVWNLKMSIARRCGVISIFAVGLVVIGIGAARVATIFDVEIDDVTLDIVTATIIAFVEPCLAIFCACCPTFMPALEAWFGKMPWKSGSSRNTIISPHVRPSVSEDDLDHIYQNVIRLQNTGISSGDSPAETRLLIREPPKR